jgi:hypothetical protein
VNEPATTGRRPEPSRNRGTNASFQRLETSLYRGPGSLCRRRIPSTTSAICTPRPASFLPDFQCGVFRRRHGYQALQPFPLSSAPAAFDPRSLTNPGFEACDSSECYLERNDRTLDFGLHSIGRGHDSVRRRLDFRDKSAPLLLPRQLPGDRRARPLSVRGRREWFERNRASGGGIHRRI